MKLKKIIESCYLCLRFPFLYPRNRFSGLHYTNWKICAYLYGEGPKYKTIEENGVWKSVIEKPTNNGICGKAFRDVEYIKYLEDGTPYNAIRTETQSKFWAAWFHIVKFWYEHVLQWIHCIPYYTELDALEPGWRKAFGMQLCDELRAQLKKEKRLYSYRITQIKEKWGYLHWYASDSIETNKIIQKYEDISWNTCIMCGKPATKISSHWISPYCDNCFPKNAVVYQQKTGNEWKETEEYRELQKKIDELIHKNSDAKNKEKV